MSSWTPVPKMTAAALGGSVATLLVWAVDAIGGVSVPPEAAAALAALAAFAFGYLKHPAGTEDTGAVSVVEACLLGLFLLVVLLLFGVLPRA